MTDPTPVLVHDPEHGWIIAISELHGDRVLRRVSASVNDMVQQMLAELRKSRAMALLGRRGTA